MTTENLPRKDALYSQWVLNFASVATANATLLGLSSGQTSMFNALANAFEDAYDESQAAKVTSKAKTGQKDAVRQSSETVFRNAAKMIGANMDVTAELKGDLGLKTTTTPVAPINPPTELSATGYANGDNVLVWRRNGNSKGAMFMIEAKAGTAANWSLVDSTNRTRYTHANQTPGLEIKYRVYSKRGEVSSSPSNQASVYDTSETPVFTLSQAA